MSEEKITLLLNDLVNNIKMHSNFCMTEGKYQPKKANTPVWPPTVQHLAPPPSSLYLFSQ